MHDKIPTFLSDSIKSLRHFRPKNFHDKVEAASLLEAPRLPMPFRRLRQAPVAYIWPIFCERDVMRILTCRVATSHKAVCDQEYQRHIGRYICALHFYVGALMVKCPACMFGKWFDASCHAWAVWLNRRPPPLRRQQLQGSLGLVMADSLQI